MQSLLYALNIGTLAAWLTVSGASTVAVAIKVTDRLPKLNGPKPDEIELAITEEVMGSAPPAAPADAAVSEEETPQEQVLQPEEIPELPEMPEIPEVPELEPLPEIPDLPAKADGELKSKPQPAVTRKSERPKQAARTTTTRRSTGPTGQGSGQGAGTAQGSGNSTSGADRWAGLYAPRPSYPSDCRRAGQEGRVGVTFTVDDRGHVVNARVSSPCAYPALNEAALASVRRYKAKPGQRATGNRTIVFRLN